MGGIAVRGRRLRCFKAAPLEFTLREVALLELGSLEATLLQVAVCTDMPLELPLFEVAQLKVAKLEVTPSRSRCAGWRRLRPHCSWWRR